MKTCTALLLISLIASTCLSGEASDVTVDHFVAKYRKAKTEFQKRDVCIALIDAGVLYDGSPIADVKKVFQQDFLDQGPADHVNDRLTMVDFVPPKHSTDTRVSTFETGWYLSITYRETDGSVVRYCLSNLGINLNPAAMRRQMERQRREQGTNLDIGLPVLGSPTNR